MEVSPAVRDFFPIVSKLGEDLLAMRRGALVRRTGTAEVKAIVMAALISPTPGHDLGVMLGVPDDKLEEWAEEAKQMVIKATNYKHPPVEKGPRLFPSEDGKRPPAGPALGIVA